jgi:nicotinate phosphoribosyltransferase
MLDRAGFANTSITLSNDLDELVIWQIITQIQEEAPRYGVDADRLIRRLVYGVGTRLVTSWGEPALGGVYKLVAVRRGGTWSSAIKISETPAKIPNPGSKRVWRLYDQRGKATADLLTLEEEYPGQSEQLVLRHPSDHTKLRILRQKTMARLESLHVQVLDEGRLVYDLPSLDEIRQRRQADVEALDPGVRRLVNPHIYHVSLSQALWDLKQQLIETARRDNVVE